MTEPAAIPETQSEVASADQSDRRRKLLGRFALILAVIAALWAVWWVITQRGRVHTDNAYVGADIAVVTPLTSGAVRDVKAGGTQLVQKGDVLVVLDDADARIELASAEAQLARARQGFRQAEAGTGAAAAMVAARGADAGQAAARRAAAQADFDRAREAYERRRGLVGSGAVSKEELDSARAAYEAARAQLNQADAAAAGAGATRQAALGELQASQAVTAGVSVNTAPEVRAAEARVAAAQLALERTVIRAPITGVVTNRNVQVGQRLQMGTPIMTLVPLDAVFVDANYKESQLRKVRPGQKVELTSDFYGSGVVFHGTVKGFAGGTGAAFALIPAQNATGNWVKVVQRLPVRIALDQADIKAHPLRVGLSMNVVIDTREP